MKIKTETAVRCGAVLAVLGLAIVPAMLSGCASTPERYYVPKLVVDIDPERMEAISYEKDIQPLLNARCVSCHSCFDAPAQLKLTCAEGVVRGATKQVVYASVRLKQAQHTRLHLDAHTEEEWREKGFFSVLPSPEAKSIEERLDSSVLYQMIALSRVYSLPQSGLLDAIVRDSHNNPFAPTLEEFDEYAATFPHAGMPFYTYGLTEDEFQTFAHWVAKGSPVEYQDVTFSPSEQAAVEAWESLLNGETLRDQLISRYLYEHWFAADLHFEEKDEPVFFRLVRSSTPPGQPVEQVVTARPNDPPGVDRVYYRFVRRPGAIMLKTHLPYSLHAEKMDSLKKLFWDTDWDIERLPPYTRQWKEQPFLVFEPIPERSRYQFLLNDSFYFVQCFIRGPVCRGQTALNVIRDHFSVMFVDPDHDLSCADPEFLPAARTNLALPRQFADFGGFLSSYGDVKERLQTYQAMQNESLNTVVEGGNPVDLSSVWQGEGSPGTPFMTVFRHFDTASVVPGFVGPTPDSAWLVDYALLERVYYLLVTNFDVFGSTAHQLATRLYFDLLRYEGESYFVRLFPPDQREPIFHSWYDGVSTSRRKKDYPLLAGGTPTLIPYEEGTDVREQLRNMLDKDRDLAALKHESVRLNKTYRSLPQTAASFVQYFPEVTFIRVINDSGEDEVYTAIRNKAHKNVAHLFKEESRREPEKDSLLLLPGLIGAYPNFMMVLREDEIEDFERRVYGADTKDKMVNAYLKFGVMRTSPEFWPTLDWFVEWNRKQDPIGAGLYDLKHYYLTQLLSLGDADLVSAPQ